MGSPAVVHRDDDGGGERTTPTEGWDIVEAAESRVELRRRDDDGAEAEGDGG